MIFCMPPVTDSYVLAHTDIAPVNRIIRLVSDTLPVRIAVAVINIVASPVFFKLESAAVVTESRTSVTAETLDIRSCIIIVRCMPYTIHVFAVAFRCGNPAVCIVTAGSIYPLIMLLCVDNDRFFIVCHN